MSTQIISSGTVTPAVTSAGDSLIVESGATALSASVLGGTERIDGTDRGATVTQHGFQGISSGGMAIGAIIEQSATQTVQPGGTAVDTTLTSGGYQIVSFGGTVSDTLVGSNSFEVISGGSAFDTTVTSAGLVVLDGFSNANGVIDSLTVDTGGMAVISANGLVDGGVIGSGGVIFALSGSTISGLSIARGGDLIEEPGATASKISGAGLVINSGVAVVQASSGVVDHARVANDLSLGSGAQVLVLPNGTAIGGTLTDGAEQSLFSGGTASGVTLSGSFQIVSSGGIASGTTLDSGSVQYVFSGGSAVGTMVDSGFSIVEAGGTALSNVINSGGNQSVDGEAIGTTVNSGGGQYVYSGALAVGTVIESGGFVFAYGVISNNGVVSPTVLSAATIEGGGYAVLSGGAEAIGVAISSGGTFMDQNGSIASATTVGPGGVMVVQPDGSALDTTVESGGTFVVLPDTSVAGTIAESGADIVSGGVAILSGPAAVTLDTSTSGLTVGSGMSNFILSGGVETGTVTGNYASSEVASGGTVVDMTISAGGELILKAGAVTSGAITFSGIDATLKTAETTLPGTVISGFAAGDAIELPTVSGSSLSATLTSANVLDVVSGGSALASFQLDPSQSLSGTSFTVGAASDGNTAVTIASSSTAEAGSVAGNAQPIDLPLYILPFDGSYKVGIEISLDGGQTYKMYEFDTGASGLYTAYNPSWWSSYSVVSDVPATNSYASGNSYIGQAVSTNLTFQTESGAPLSVGNATVGLITSAENPGVFTAQNWDSDLTGTPTTAPLDDWFYGDFGMGLGSDNGGGIEAILAQLGGGLSNGFIVNLGTAPDASTGQIGYLQVGLTQADIASFGTIIPMQGQNTLDTFPNSNEPTYTKILGSGTLSVSNEDGTYTEPGGFVFDTGAPEMSIHAGSSGIDYNSLKPFLDGKSSLATGTTVALSAPGISTSASSWNYGFEVMSGHAGNEVKVSDDGNDYVNTGIGAFFGQSVAFDLADGEIGFEPVSCFARGTRIATVSGAVAVEALRIGDRVTTVSGEARPIIWIGRRSIDCRRHPTPETVSPVRLQAHAFGPGLPQRDLLLSPDHALYLDGVLIPVKYLINGDTVAQQDCRHVTYYHLELASHDVILAEGLPAETYLETGHRAAFSNGDAAVQLHPIFAPETVDAQLRWEAVGYAPLAVTGTVVESARQTLKSREGLAARQPRYQMK
jgi:autotransporter passenger strand-loop-strand repeat protein